MIIGPACRRHLTRSAPTHPGGNVIQVASARLPKLSRKPLRGIRTTARRCRLRSRDHDGGADTEEARWMDPGGEGKLGCAILKSGLQTCRYLMRLWHSAGVICVLLAPCLADTGREVPQLTGADRIMRE